jgi:PAS domain S-box-containing protein
MFDRKLTDEQFHVLFESAPNGVVLVDSAGRIVLLNAQMEKMFGYRRDELIGCPIETLVSERLRAKHSHDRREFGHAASARPMGSGRDLFGQRKNGSEIPIEIGLNPIVFADATLVLATVVDITERKEAEREHQDLRRHMVHALSQERLRLAHELHDMAGQSLTVVMLELKRLEMELNPAERSRLRELRKQLDELGKTLHRVAWELRPASIDELGLASALSDYISEWGARANVVVDFYCGDNGIDGIADDVRTNIFRVVQEALTNIAKHAHATSASVVIDRVHEWLQLTIEDDGCGFDTSVVPKRPVVWAGGGLGLVGMRERLTLVRGELEIESSSGVGTTIYVRIPVEPKNTVPALTERMTA